MKKIGLLLALLIVIIGCTSSENTPEQNSLKMPVQNLENISDTKESLDANVDNAVINKEMPAPEREPVKEAIVKEESLTPENSVCVRTFTPTFSSGSHYTGPLFDAHFHMPLFVGFGEVSGHDGSTDPILDKDVSLKEIICLLDKENSRGLIGFVLGLEYVLDPVLEKTKLVKEQSDKLHLFLMQFNYEPDALENIQRNNQGLFEGYGEIAFYLPMLKNRNPDDQGFLQIYSIAKKNNFIIMIHPDSGDETQIENAIRDNPDVQFLLHGPEIESKIANLMSKYDNVYYSIDAILIRKTGSPGGLIYTTNSVEELTAYFNKNYHLMMNDAVRTWKPMIEKYPNRFMWGTDRSYKWHFNEQVSLLLEEFGRDFIADLDPAVQENFAYKNAESLLS
ncbi:amidohydrolase family protein [Candidatus Woesearchaeota archaeon]|nr:amidohydrolase family protein [Candidatus Woesearchaeota archaeon]